jgi:hypothetical protein
LLRAQDPVAGVRIPAVIEDKGVEVHPPLVDKLLVKKACGVEEIFLVEDTIRPFFIVRVPEVIP